MSTTTDLAEFVCGLSYEDLPEEVSDEAKRAAYNVVGVTVAGASDPVGRHIASYVERQFPHDGTATVVGYGRTSPVGAALANGAFPSVHHYDDTFDSLLVHPSASAFPAALAAGELAGTDGRRLLAGYVAGIETIYHVGRSLAPNHAEHGWHATGTAGTFGAVAASASVLGLTTRETRNAFGIVASGSSALRRNIGTNTNHLHTGHAAQVGLRASLIARDGFTADENVFEESMNYGEVMTPTAAYEPSEITDSLGSEWGTIDLGYKPYPSAGISHGALEALLRLMNDEGLTGGNVATVRVNLDPSLSDILDARYPRSGSDAHASIEYCLAVALQRGQVSIEDFTDERVRDDALRAEWEKITCDFGTPLGDGFAQKGARVVVTTLDGQEHRVGQQIPPGSPDNPLSDDRLTEKFGSCMMAADAAVDAAEALSIFEQLETEQGYVLFESMAEQFTL